MAAGCCRRRAQRRGSWPSQPGRRPGHPGDTHTPRACCVRPTPAPTPLMHARAAARPLAGTQDLGALLSSMSI